MPERPDSAETPSRIPITFDFDPRIEGIDVPDGSTVFLMCEHTTPPWKSDPNFLMRKEGDRYVLKTEFPAGIRLEYKFFVNPPDRPGFWVPEGANRVREITAAETSSREESRGEAEPSEVAQFRSSVGGEVQSILALGQGISTLEGRDRRQRAKEVHRGLVAFGMKLRASAETRDEGLRAFIKSDLRREIENNQSRSIAERRDLPLGARELLSTPQGRLTFDVNVFHQLCDTQACGLKAKDRMSGRITESDFYEKARKALGSYWPMYRRITSSYHGGNIVAALDGMAEEIAQNTPQDFAEREKKRAFGRFALAQRMQGRMQKQVGQETEEVYATIDKSGRWSKFLAEGGDLAMKFMVAPMLLASGHPLLAAGAWGSRGISEFFARDFAGAVTKVTKGAARLPGRMLKGGLKLLPKSWTSKSETLQSWLDEPSAPSFEKVGRASLPWEVRKKLLGRGFIPAPGLLEHIPYVKMIVPERKAYPGEAAFKEMQKAEDTIQSACRKALNISGGPVAVDVSERAA